MNRVLIFIITFSLCIAPLACSAARPAEASSAASTAVTATATEVATVEPSATDASAATTEFSVTSEGISNGALGEAYGAHGEQKTNGIPSRSFPLSMSSAPEGTACFALSVIDPDGGNWVHWLAVNILAQSLAENASIDLAGSLVQGENDFRQVGYGGPTPPSGTHTYVITVYALSAPVSLENGFSLKQFNAAIENNVLARAVLTGDYSN